MIIFPGGVRQKRNFRRGGGVRFGSQFLENPEGRGVIGKNPFRGGGGMDVFWNYTILVFTKKRTVIRGCNSWLDSDSKAGEW